MKVGFYCQKEVVMPVVIDGMFVGHNRFDIMVTEKQGTKTIINILEIKTLSKSISNSKTKQRIFEQCLGYRNCVKNLTTDANTKINVFLVNIWKKQSVFDIVTPYKYDVIDICQLGNKDKEQRHEKIPRPLVIKNIEYFEIEALMKSEKSRVRNKRVLVKWVGVPAPSWEPIANIPNLIKKKFKHIIQKTNRKKS